MVKIIQPPGLEKRQALTSIDFPVINAHAENIYPVRQYKTMDIGKGFKQNYIIMMNSAPSRYRNFRVIKQHETSI